MAVVSNKFDSAVKDLCEKYFKNYIDTQLDNLNIKYKKTWQNNKMCYYNRTWERWCYESVLSNLTNTEDLKEVRNIELLY